MQCLATSRYVGACVLDGVPLQRPKFNQVREQCAINNYGYNYTSTYVHTSIQDMLRVRKPMSITVWHCILSIAFSACYMRGTCILNVYMALNLSPVCTICSYNYMIYSCICTYTYICTYLVQVCTYIRMCIITMLIFDRMNVSE